MQVPPPMTMRADTVLAMANAVSAGADTNVDIGRRYSLYHRNDP